MKPYSNKPIRTDDSRLLYSEINHGKKSTKKAARQQSKKIIREESQEDDWEVVAKQLMKNIMYDNGAVNRFNPERYRSSWVKKIAVEAKLFFEANESLLNDEAMDEICCGELSENDDKYGGRVGWAELNNVLNNYFNSGMR